jgi:hypothetical protein
LEGGLTKASSQTGPHTWGTAFILDKCNFQIWSVENQDNDVK